MTIQEIKNKIFASDIFKKWHYFHYHFNFYLNGHKHLLAESIVNSIESIEKHISNVGINYINKIASINNKEMDIKHYDQLLQVLAEMLIVNHVVSYDWHDFIDFKYEPKSSSSNKNPELLVVCKENEIGIEVKAPEFVKKHNERSTKAQQLPSRSTLINSLEKQNIMLPRDNSVKDFLISANNKFEGFKYDNPRFYGVLVIVWDDFIYEPISALISQQAGLFTSNSFAKDENGEVLNFINIDCVIITRHLVQIKNGSRDEPLPSNCQHPLDYGRANEFPNKIIIKNPNSNLEIPNEVLDCFQALKPGPELGAEYLPIDLIMWFNNQNSPPITTP